MRKVIIRRKKIIGMEQGDFHEFYFKNEGTKAEKTYA